jgi:hypothetical protein
MDKQFGRHHVIHRRLKLLEYRTLLETHIDPVFAAQVPIIQFILEEGVKVFTNIHMNWDGIQGIPLLEWTVRKIHHLYSNLSVGQSVPIYLRWQKKNLTDSEAIFSSHPTVRFVVTLWWHQKRHILSCASVVTTLPSTSTSDMDTIQYLSSEANLIGF